MFPESSSIVFLCSRLSIVFKDLIYIAMQGRSYEEGSVYTLYSHRTDTGIRFVPSIVLTKLNTGTSPCDLRQLTPHLFLNLWSFGSSFLYPRPRLGQDVLKVLPVLAACLPDCPSGSEFTSLQPLTSPSNLLCILRICFEWLFFLGTTSQLLIPS